MTFDVDLSYAGPTESFYGFRMTWRSALRVEEAWPGQTWRDRYGQPSPRRVSPRGRALKGYRGSSDNFSSPSQRRQPGVGTDDGSQSQGQAPQGQVQRQKRFEHPGRRPLGPSRSDPGLGIRLPCLISGGPDGSSSGKVCKKGALGQSRSVQRSESSHLPALAPTPEDGVADVSPVAGNGGTKRRRRARPRDYDNPTAADKAIAQSHGTLSKAAGLLAESRCYGTVPVPPHPARARRERMQGGTLWISPRDFKKAAVEIQSPAAPAESNSQPAITDEGHSTDTMGESTLSEAASPKQSSPAQPAPAASPLKARIPRRKDNLTEISSMSTSILDQLDGAYKTLQERSSEAALRIQSPCHAASTPSSPSHAASSPTHRSAVALLSAACESPKSSGRGRLDTDAASGAGETRDASNDGIDLTGSAPSPIAADSTDETRDRTESDIPGGFSVEAAERMRGAFFRFTEPFSYDLDVSNLVALVKHLGHGVTKTIHDGIFTIVKDITPYEYLDFDEFLVFMSKFLVFAEEETRRVFNSFDDDGSGELSVLELRHVMKSLGIVPYNAMLLEAISVVDKDCNGQLDFEEFKRFLHSFQYNDGFTSPQVDHLRLIHSRLSTLEGGKMPLDRVADALVLFYGILFAKESNAMMEKLMEKQKKEGAKADVPAGLSFHDFLLLARELREVLYESEASKFRPAMRMSVRGSVQSAEFASSDTDGNGSISQKEMWKTLEKDEYEPLQVVLDEIFSEVVYEPLAGLRKWRKGHELDFDQFFDFLLLFRQRECFLKAEVDALWDIFSLFDEDGSGTICTVELADIFRHLGYTLTHDDIQHFVLQVDENESHTLDFKEFLHLMQLHRSSEISDMHEAFDNNCEDQEDVEREDKRLGVNNIVPALKDIGYDMLPQELKDNLETMGPSIEFSQFVMAADECRKTAVASGRRMAGFTGEEIEKLRTSFNKWDKDHSGTISCVELLPVLEEFGWKPKTREDVETIMARLGKARAEAKQAGVEECTPDGMANVNFWEFVQLARMIQRHDETIYEEKMSALALELSFTHHELAEFQEIFHTWATKSHQDDSDSEDPDDKKKESCSKEYTRRLVRSLGMKFTPERRHAFDDELNTLIPNGEQLDFTAFLRLMRWVLDTHFADEVTEQYDQTHIHRSALH